MSTTSLLPDFLLEWTNESINIGCTDETTNRVVPAAPAVILLALVRADRKPASPADAKRIDSVVNTSLASNLKAKKSMLGGSCI